MIQRWGGCLEAYKALGVLLDLYMGRSEDALGYYRQYNDLLPEPSVEVKGWIADIERQLGIFVEEPPPQEEQLQEQQTQEGQLEEEQPKEEGQQQEEQHNGDSEQGGSEMEPVKDSEKPDTDDNAKSALLDHMESMTNG